MAYVATNMENIIGMAVNLIEVASEEPLSVDGTVFVSLPLADGDPGEEVGVVPEGESVGEAATQF